MLLRFFHSYPMLSLNLKFPFTFPFRAGIASRAFPTKASEQEAGKRDKNLEEKFTGCWVKRVTRSGYKVCVGSKAGGSSIAQVAGQSSLKRRSPRIGWMSPLLGLLGVRSFALSPLLLIHTSSFVGFVSRDNAAPGFLSYFSLFLALRKHEWPATHRAG